MFKSNRSSFYQVLIPYSDSMMLKKRLNNFIFMNGAAKFNRMTIYGVTVNRMA